MRTLSLKLHKTPEMQISLHHIPVCCVGEKQTLQSRGIKRPSHVVIMPMCFQMPLMLSKMIALRVQDAKKFMPKSEPPGRCRRGFAEQMCRWSATVNGVARQTTTPANPSPSLTRPFPRSPPCRDPTGSGQRCPGRPRTQPAACSAGRSSPAPRGASPSRGRPCWLRRWPRTRASGFGRWSSSASSAGGAGIRESQSVRGDRLRLARGCRG